MICSVGWCVVLPVVDASCFFPVPPGGHPGFCQSLQRHLCVLGFCLPAGPHLPDTSLLLGRHQSQLPREQLCLGATILPRLLPLHCWKDKPTLFIFLFFCPICLADFRTGGNELKETVVFLECVCSEAVWFIYDDFYCMFGERRDRLCAWCFSF